MEVCVYCLFLNSYSCLKNKTHRSTAASSHLNKNLLTLETFFLVGMEQPGNDVSGRSSQAQFSPKLCHVE